MELHLTFLSKMSLQSASALPAIGKQTSVRPEAESFTSVDVNLYDYLNVLLQFMQVIARKSITLCYASKERTTFLNSLHLSARCSHLFLNALSGFFFYMAILA